MVQCLFSKSTCRALWIRLLYIVENSAQKIPELGLTYGKLADKIRNESLDILETLAEVDFSIEYIPELLQKKNYSVMSDDLKDRFSTVCRYICSI